jgi:hypothetical protein
MRCRILGGTHEWYHFGTRIRNGPALADVEVSLPGRELSAKKHQRPPPPPPELKPGGEDEAEISPEPGGVDEPEICRVSALPRELPMLTRFMDVASAPPWYHVVSTCQLHVEIAPAGAYLVTQAHQAVERDGGPGKQGEQYHDNYENHIGRNSGNPARPYYAPPGRVEPTTLGRADYGSLKLREEELLVDR